MIDTIIFSKDRAMQLELLLRSIRDNFKELTNIHILVKGTTEDFNSGYLKLAKMYPEHKWVAESDIVKNVQNIINSFESKYAMTFVDDEIVIRDHSVKPMLDILEEFDNIHCASLRLGNNIGDYCYTADLSDKKPKLDFMRDGSGVCKWDWTKGDGRVDWYYPSCINSHIYSTQFLKDWINKMSFGNINDLEGNLNRCRSEFKHYMICMEKSKTINVANNLTQTGYNRHSNKPEFTLEELNKKFLEGFIIDSKDFYNINNDIATFEKDYRLIKG